MPERPGNARGRKRNTRKEMISIVKRFYRALNARNYEEIQELVSKDHIDHTWFGTDEVKPQAVTRLFSMIQSQAPDWYETVDEIFSVDEETGWVSLLATGRGSVTGKFLGREWNGEQLAAPIIHNVRILDGKIVAYRGTKPGGFENPFTEPISAPGDVQAIRAEQGGPIVGREIDEEERDRAISAYAEGNIDTDELAERLMKTTKEARRCQALVDESMRRCLNPALPGSIYCQVHQDVAEVHKATP